MFKASIYISHFLDLHKKQKIPNIVTELYITDFLFITPFAFTFQKKFCENPCHRTTLCHISPHMYTVKKFCCKIPNEKYLKTGMELCY